ncbi:MAG: DUF6338 family protein [candidate division WOR-3 bacterium]|nr:DUF6338 family protein [candidate division WOR-3 bacterium]
MPTNFTALYILLILLPGFVTSKITSAIVVKKTASELGQVIDALVFTLIDLALFIVITSILKFNLTTITSSSSTSAALVNIQKFVIMIFIIAIIVGILHGWAINKDLYYKLLRTLGITTITGSLDVWNQVFNTYLGCIVRIRMNNNSIIEGWPEYFSDTADSMSLFLRDVVIISKDGKEEKIPALMITNKEEVKLIEFYHEKKLSPQDEN